MSRGIFITGTDTGVGKTVVTAGIVHWLRRQGIDAVPVKPVQTGSEAGSPDLDLCLTACGIQPRSEEKPLMSPYVYELACSPHLAGRLARNYPQIARIKDCVDKLLLSHQAVVVEGAGGIMVPLNEQATMLDLMQALGYPVVLVSRFGLGTINHTLLSIQALRTAGLKLIGVAFNYTQPPQLKEWFIEADNPPTIAQFGEVRILGRIRCLRNLNPKDKNTWDAFEEDMSGLNLILDELNGR